MSELLNSVQPLSMVVSDKIKAYVRENDIERILSAAVNGAIEDFVAGKAEAERPLQHIAAYLLKLDAEKFGSGKPVPSSAEPAEPHPQGPELFEAVGEGDVDRVTELLEEGVPASSLDDDCNTPLILACEGETECAPRCCWRTGRPSTTRTTMGRAR